MHVPGKRARFDPDQVILPGNIKEEVMDLAKGYSETQSREARVLIDEFYGYGTGLTFLFHGPVRHRKDHAGPRPCKESRDRELISVNMDEASNMGVSSEDLIKHVFKEARLCNGIVFLDECDETPGERVTP